MSLVWVDGRLLPAGALATAHGTRAGVFETLGAVAGELPLWPLHLGRLAAAAATLGIAFDPPADLHTAARQLLADNDHRDDILRITLRPRADTVSWALGSRPRAVVEGPVRLVPVDAATLPDLVRPGIKATERAHHDAALARARQAGGDDGLLCGPDGEVLETAVGNLFVGARGLVTTPPADLGILPGIARGLLLDALPDIREATVTLADVRSADWLAVTNAVHGPRLAVLRSAPAASGDRRGFARLLAAWRAQRL